MAPSILKIFSKSAMTNTSADYTAPLTAADGTPLKKKLRQALFRSRVRALGLVVPLLILIIMAFLIPIVMFLGRGVLEPKSDSFSTYMLNISPILQEWDGNTPPTEAMYAALVADLVT